MMLKRLLACAILSTALSQAAFAGPSNSSSADNAKANANTSAQMSSNQSAQASQTLPQEIRSKLQKDGYTDVKVVPSSFMVQAKDSDGDSVLMMIGPHSTTIISAMNANQESATTGSSTSSGSGHATAGKDSDSKDSDSKDSK